MKRIFAGVMIALFLFICTSALAQEWECAQCGNAASGNFCNNCGMSAEDSKNYQEDGARSLIGETVVIEDVCEFRIEDASFIDRLDPENPASYYSYYEADEGKKYFCIKVAYTNLESDTVSMEGFGFNASLIKAELTYAERYNYSGFLCYEEDLMGLGGSMTSAFLGSIDPLCTATMYYLIEVPDAVYEGTESVSVILEIGKNEYELIVR